MSLKNLRKMIVKNQLKCEVTDVSVVYHESNISANNWHNLKEVNVETLKNILWCRRVAFSTNGGKVQPLSTIEQKAGHVCFGSNDGYWQVYFTCADSGMKYRLERNDCEMTLSKDCHEKDLNIELNHVDDKCSSVKVKFEISSLRMEFKAIEGEPIPRGVKVWVRNRTDGIVNVSSFILIETRDSASDVMTATNRQKATFDENVLKLNAATVCKENILYDCFHRQHKLELFFSSNGNCYEIRDKGKPYVPVKLTEADYGNVIDIDIVSQRSNPLDISVKIRTSGEEICHKMEMTGSISGRKQHIRKIVECLRNNLFEEMTNELVKRLKDIPVRAEMKKADIGHENQNGPESELIRLRDPEMDPVRGEATIDGLKFKVAGDAGISLNRLKELSLAFDRFKEIWEKLKNSLLILDRLLETLDIEDDIEMSRISKDSKIICCMCVTDVLCSVLKLTGLEENDLTFDTSNFQPAKEVSICPQELANALEQELNLWKHGVFSDAGKDISNDDAISKQLFFCKQSLMRHEKIFNIFRLILIDGLKKIANELHHLNRNVNLGLLTSSSIGIVGAGLSVVGLVTAPFTAAASLAFLAAGLGAGAASGVVGVGTTIADSVLSKSFLSSTISLAESYVHIFNQLTDLRLLIAEQSDQLQTRTGDECFEIKNLAKAASSMAAYIGVNAAKMGAQVAKTAAFRVGSVALGLIFDLNGLIVRSINMSRGALSELGSKLEAEAMLLEMEMIEERSTVHHPTIDVNRGREKKSDKIEANSIHNIM